MNKDSHRYNDMIDLPHPVSKKHPQMSMQDRAAQFAPFAALTGHAEAIERAQQQAKSEKMPELLQKRTGM